VKKKGLFKDNQRNKKRKNQSNYRAKKILNLICKVKNLNQVLCKNFNKFRSHRSRSRDKTR